MFPEENPETNTTDETAPVDIWAEWYARECEENAVKPVVLPKPTSGAVLVSDIGESTEPNPATPGGAGSPPPMVPGQ